MRSGVRGIVQGHSTILGDLLAAEGIQVHYSILDNDDTLASHAVAGWTPLARTRWLSVPLLSPHSLPRDTCRSADGASVLSADSDFFRYTFEGCAQGEAPYSVFSAFEICPSGLMLRPHPRPAKKEGVEWRSIIVPPPETAPSDPSMITVRQDAVYIRGVPCAPLAQRLPNPHDTARPVSLFYAPASFFGSARDSVNRVETKPLTPVAASSV